MIDFTTLFAKKTVERLTFETRKDINYKHEIIFLSSYLHDATFRRSNFKQVGNKIEIELDRDCWEFYTRIHQVGDALLAVTSRLTIVGVDQCTWSRQIDDQELTIRSIFVGEREYMESDTAHLVLFCDPDGLRIDLVGGDYFFKIRLEDLNDPA